MTAKQRPITPAYLWFDTEFTSLDLEEARLLQVALLSTDSALRPLAPPERDVNLFIALEPETRVSEWVEENQADVLKRCRADAAVSLEEADARLARAVDEAVGPRAASIKLRPVLAGNSVYMDMTLVRKHLPRFADRVNYGLLDVSSLKVLWNDWHGGTAFDKDDGDLVRRFLPEGCALPSGCPHDAYYDVHASLAELNHYRQQWGWSADGSEQGTGEPAT
jgi:oligoribonuclease